MTPEHDPYDEHLQAMGRALHAAPGRRRAPRRARPLVVAGLGAAVAAVLIALLVGVPGRSPVDVLGRAEAALAPDGGLVHYVVRETTVGGRRLRTPCPRTGVVEVWQAPRLRRWRALLPAHPEGRGCSHWSDARGLSVRGPVQLSWDAGTSSRYVARTGTLDTVRGYAPGSPARLVPVGDPEFGDGDPVETIRVMLAAGRLHDDGPSTLDGRRVRTLTGSREEGGVRDTVRYAVDIDTFDPVRVTTRRQATATPTTGRDRRYQRFWRTFGSTTRTIDVVRYERLPLDAAGRRLLKIRPARPPKHVTNTTPIELRRAAERRAARRNRQDAARARRAHRGRAARGGAVVRRLPLPGAQVPQKVR